MGEKSNGLDAMTMLATGVQAQPGVYAVLLGSGVSTAAGIPTGWGVMTDLVHRAAVAKDPEDAESIKLAATDPEAWWSQHGVGETLDYSSLLEQLIPTGPARQGTLSAYFEATEEEAEEGKKVPTAAHHAIATLVRRGSIRVVVTTNFDRLMEQALDAAGVSAQVIHRADQIPAMTPLTHAAATVIKVHGDYHDQDMRNTVSELTDYPEELVDLLARIVDEYGLITSGWSADWDKALVKSMEGRRSRRYPLYWDSRSSKGTNAKNLLALHRGIVINASSADDLFVGLLQRVEALDQMAEPPITTAIAVARLKRNLLDPLRQIDLHDLVLEAAGRAADHAACQSVAPGGSWAELDALYAGHRAAVTPLLHLLGNGVWYDDEAMHADLWTDALQRLLDARGIPQGTFNEAKWRMQHYPALLGLWTMGLAAVARRREGLLLQLLTEARWQHPFGARQREPAADVLTPNHLLDPVDVNKLPRWDITNGWLYPASHMLRADLEEPTAGWLNGPDQYKTTFNGLEYRVGLAGFKMTGRLTLTGEFLIDRYWSGGQPEAEIAFREAAARAGSSWPWWSFLECDDEAKVDNLLESYREQLSKHQRWG